MLVALGDVDGRGAGPVDRLPELSVLPHSRLAHLDLGPALFHRLRYLVVHVDLLEDPFPLGRDLAVLALRGVMTLDRHVDEGVGRGVRPGGVDQAQLRRPREAEAVERLLALAAGAQGVAGARVDADHDHLVPRFIRLHRGRDARVARLAFVIARKPVHLGLALRPGHEARLKGRLEDAEATMGDHDLRSVGDRGQDPVANPMAVAGGFERVPKPDIATDVGPAADFVVAGRWFQDRLPADQQPVHLDCPQVLQARLLPHRRRPRRADHRGTPAGLRGPDEAENPLIFPNLAPHLVGGLDPLGEVPVGAPEDDEVGGRVSEAVPLEAVRQRLGSREI